MVNDDAIQIDPQASEGEVLRLGTQVEVVAADSGEAVVRNTDTGTEVQLSSLVDIVGGDLNLGGNGINDVASVDGGGSAVALDDDLDGGSTSSLTNLSSVSTDELYSAPAGAILQKDSDQTISNDTITTVSWQSAIELNSAADSFADLANNGITIPNDKYERARITVLIAWRSQADLQNIRARKNGAPHNFGIALFDSDLTASWWPTITSGWIPISKNDTFTIEVNQDSGGPRDISQSKDSTFFQLEVR